MTVPTADMPIAPGESVVVDRLVTLSVRKPPPPRWAGDSRDLYEFLPPGFYEGHFEVALPRGEKVVSGEFQLTILKARGQDADARDAIKLRHAGFFEGRDAAPEESYYHGGKWWKKVDVSRFGEIQKILEDYPDSEYAEWIRFWKVYHHGSEEEALEYARAHEDFPLSDNLMFRVINRVANDDARHDQAVELLAELQRIFPNGDTADRAEALRKKLLNKKRRP